MIVFDVKCKVLKPITVADSGGNEVEIPAGSYHLKGIDHLVQAAAGGVEVTGMDLRIEREGDADTAYTVTAEALAKFISLDDVEVTI